MSDWLTVAGNYMTAPNIDAGTVKRILIQLVTIAFLGMISFIIWSANTQQKFGFLQFGVAFPYADKLAHFLLIGSATFLLNLSLQNRTIAWLGRKWLLGSLIVFILITLEEFSQRFIPGRSFDLLDLTANCAGIFCFGLLSAKRR